MMVEVTRTFLEMRDPSQLNRRPMPGGDIRVIRLAPCPVSEYRDMYRRVGDQWHWHDRHKWSDDQLARHLAQPTVSVWPLYVDRKLGGYFELEQQANDDVEIVYFGLTPEFIGRGFGAALLTRAVDEAFGLGAKRVWLHTCTLDSPRALPNYKARGFRETGKIEKYVVQLAD
jgi:GNAT superfamily N-acetyltransferase